MNPLKYLIEKAAKIEHVPAKGAAKFSLDERFEETFFDDFDGDCLKSCWQHEKEGVRRAGYWANDAVFVKDSMLTIRTQYRENGALGPGWYMGAVTTGHINPEKGTGDEAGFTGFSQTGGYFECRCKVPKACGFWAAFWLMPDNHFENDVPGTGEDGAEVDVFESPFAYQSYCPEVVTHAVHIDGYGDELKSVGSPQFKVEHLYDEFHTYGVEWTDSEYIFYVDGYETFRTKDKVGTVSKVSEYLLLSVEIAGAEKDGALYPGKEFVNGKWKKFWCGNPEKNDKNQNYDFLVDYVKVYQKKA